MGRACESNSAGRNQRTAGLHLLSCGIVNDRFGTQEPIQSCGHLMLAESNCGRADFQAKIKIRLSHLSNCGKYRREVQYFGRILALKLLRFCERALPNTRHRPPCAHGASTAHFSLSGTLRLVFSPAAGINRTRTSTHL